jgi:hypothetical protein
MGVLLTFHQSYQPVGDSLLLSALVAGLPLYVLFVMLAVLAPAGVDLRHLGHTALRTARQRQPDPHRRHQLFRWRHGQDDQPAEPVSGGGGREQGRRRGEIFRRVIRYSIILTALVGVVAMIEGYVVPFIIPSP